MGVSLAKLKAETAAALVSILSPLNSGTNVCFTSFAVSPHVLEGWVIKSLKKNWLVCGELGQGHCKPHPDFPTRIQNSKVLGCSEDETR